MSESFWETTQIARREHFCDWCGNSIEPGEFYFRRARALRGTRRLHIFREHAHGCPPDYEEFARKIEQMQCAETAIAIVLEIRVVEVLVIERDGKVVTRSETILVPALVGTTTLPEDDYVDGDNDIPF